MVGGITVQTATETRIEPGKSSDDDDDNEDSKDSKQKKIQKET